MVEAIRLRYFLFACDCAAVVVFVCFWFYTGPTLAQAPRLLPIALWNAMPFVALHAASHYIGRTPARTRPTMIVIAIVIAASTFVYGRLLLSTVRASADSYEPNLIWLFAPAVLLVFVAVGSLVTMFVRVN